MEKATLAHCPVCGHSLASSAWICRGCGAANRAKRRETIKACCLTVFSLAFVLTFAVFLLNIVGLFQKTEYISGQIGAYGVEILSAERVSDEYSDMLLEVKIKWTNGSDIDTYFSDEIVPRAYQNGLYCINWRTSETETVAAGDSAVISLNFSLRYEDEPINIELNSLFFPSSWNMFDNKVVKTFVPPQVENLS
ncbi:MAG: DUF5067 domain-containing protein [Oscillospiraceae bacterium]|jgi:predicted nucleic acid-binding Zn ribbon protein|nr:DUF5067 domain-containing protein [Oscillospiraceae bacterium]